MSSIEVKIRKLDGELARYKEQMNKLRNGPGKVRRHIFYLRRMFKKLMFQKQAIQQRALRTLKQKRMYEAQIDQLAQQTLNMESAALTTENLRNTMATVDAMQMANKEIRKQYGKLDIDQIEVRTFSSLGKDFFGLCFLKFFVCFLVRIFIMIWQIY